MFAFYSINIGFWFLLAKQETKIFSKLIFFRFEACVWYFRYSVVCVWHLDKSMSLQFSMPLGNTMTTLECWPMDLSFMVFVFTESVCLQDCKGMVGFHLVVKSISVCVLVFLLLVLRVG